VAGLAKAFDYLMPPGMEVRVGSVVRVDLSGRRVGGWVTGLGPSGADGVRALRPIAKVRGWGPEPEVVELAGWGAWRWATLDRSLLVTASATHAVPGLPAPALRVPSPPAAGQVPAGLLDRLPLDRAALLRLPPAHDVTPVVAALAQRGPVLVVVPSLARADVLAGRLRRAGGGVAVLPGQWAQARAGAAVVIGTRAAAWGPCPGLAAVVVVDSHAELLGHEGAPTWHAVDVAVERARRAGVPCVVTSACPTLDLLAGCELRTVDRVAERHGWATVEVVDRRNDDPRLGLYSDRLTAALRQAGRVVCVLNRTGRARLLACGRCGSLVRCERCGAALATGPDGLDCPRCFLARPAVCAVCDSTRLRAVRVGVSRAREELEALAGRPVGEVTAVTGDLPLADVLVGTEAVLHRLSPRDRVGLVAFLDFDQEVLAPRVRAGEEALALLAEAARLVGGRSGRVVVQTRVPDHPTIRAAVAADPAVLAASETEIRRALRLPPYSAVALVSGAGAAEYVDGLRAQLGLEVVGPHHDEWMVKAAEVAALADGLAAVPRPAARLRVAVTPARL
jgi:primosomal protein N' (replication factor Y)